MTEGLQILATRRFDPGAGGEVPLPPGCRQRWGTTRLVAADLVDLTAGPDHVITFGAREVRVHDRHTGALRTWIHLMGELGRGVADADGEQAWVVGWRKDEVEIPGIGRAFLRRPCAAQLDLVAGRLDPLAGEVPSIPRHLAVDPAGRYLAVSPSDGHVRVLALPGGEALGEVGLAYPLDRVGFSTDGTRLEAAASGNPNPMAELNDRTPWRQARGSWSLPDLVGDVVDEEYRSPDRAHRPRPEQALVVLRSRLEPRAASEGGPPEWAQFALAEGASAAPEDWPDPTPPGVIVPFPGGPWLLGGDEAGAVWVADIRTRTIHGPVLGDPGRIEALAIAPDGASLVVAHAAGSVLAWDLAELFSRIGVAAPDFRARCPP